MTDLGEIRERREALFEAVVALEAALAAPASDHGWLGGVGEALSFLHRTLDEHVAETEAPDGFLSQVRVDAPRLSNQVDHLVADHATLTADTERLIDELDRAPSERTKAETDDVRERSLALLAAVVRHRHRGADLIYEAYNVDVGGPG